MITTRHRSKEEPVYLQDYARKTLIGNTLDAMLAAVHEALIERKVYWLRGIALQNHLTSHEMNEHCEIDVITYPEFPPRGADFVQVYQITIHWTRWMRFKRAIRRLRCKKST